MRKRCTERRAAQSVDLLSDDTAREIAQFAQGVFKAADGEPIGARKAVPFQRRPPDPPVEANCICSKELAAHLVDLLLSGNDGAEPRVIRTKRRPPVSRRRSRQKSLRNRARAMAASDPRSRLFGLDR